MDDSTIVALYFRRDESAIEHTREKYGQRLRDLSFHIVEDAQTAEESENDTYLEAWLSIPPHAPENYLYCFLARITRNISLNRCRERSRLKRQAHLCELSEEMAQCVPSPDNVEYCLENKALGNAINGFLGSLSREKRGIFVRRYWFLDSISEISVRYAISESKTKTTLHRCREKLRKHLEKEGFSI